jgi:hypothetical protein
MRQAQVRSEEDGGREVDVSLPRHSALLCAAIISISICCRLTSRLTC